MVGKIKIVRKIKCWDNKKRLGKLKLLEKNGWEDYKCWENKKWLGKLKLFGK